MANKFKYMSNSNFPSVDNINVYQRPDYDYSNYSNAQQMTITLCSVPWDMGIVHVGNAQIGGVGNVVSFDGGEKERDAWFDALTKKWTWKTNYRKFHNENENLKIPLPLDEAICYNYAYIDYEPIATAEHLLYGESKDGGMRRWFFFVRNATSDSPNCTSLELVPDYWQQYSYNLDIPYMQLERGHYGLARTTIEDYLSNPIENSSYLLADDVNFGNEPSRVAYQSTEVINTDVVCIFALCAQPNWPWGGAYSTLPADACSVIDGVPGAVYLMAIECSDFEGFMDYIEEVDPQFKTAVKGIFFAPRDLVTLGSEREWGDYHYYDVEPKDYTNYICIITGVDPENTQAIIDNSQYPDRYKRIPKLYTSPYAHFEISDGLGHTVVIRIEDTAGSVRAITAFNMSFPEIGITCHLEGVGSGQQYTKRYENLSERYIELGGSWYEYLWNWDVPVFSVVQDNSITNLCKNKYLYEARENQAATDRDNAQRIAATEKTNADNQADAIVTNASINTAAASAVTEQANAASTKIDLDATVLFNNSTTTVNNIYTDQNASAEIKAAEQGATIGAATTVAQGVMSMVSSAVNLDIAGSVSAIPSAILNAGSSLAQNQVGVNLTKAQANISKTSALSANELNNELITTKVATSTYAQTQRTNTQNSATEGVAANASNVAKTNASNSKNTTDTNANATYDAAITQIEKEKQQAALQPPNEYGVTMNNRNVYTTPICLTTSLVTQSVDAIAQAGDEFLRYGYFINRNVEFNGNWNVMDKFSYWKCADIWIKNLAQPDAPTDQLRYFLMGGVTIWRKPEYIGNTSIYDNGV